MSDMELRSGRSTSEREISPPTTTSGTVAASVPTSIDAGADSILHGEVSPSGGETMVRSQADGDTVKSTAGVPAGIPPPGLQTLGVAGVIPPYTMTGPVIRPTPRYPGPFTYTGFDSLLPRGPLPGGAGVPRMPALSMAPSLQTIGSGNTYLTASGLSSIVAAQASSSGGWSHMPAVTEDSGLSHNSPGSPTGSGNAPRCSVVDSQASQNRLEDACQDVLSAMADLSSTMISIGMNSVQGDLRPLPSASVVDPTPTVSLSQGSAPHNRPAGVLHGAANAAHIAASTGHKDAERGPGNVLPPGGVGRHTVRRGGKSEHTPSAPLLRRKVYRSTTDHSSSESSDEDDSALTSGKERGSMKGATRGKYVKIPPFLGKEPWDVWYNRFMDIADRHQWSTRTKLDELLPRLQGQAGEFVYGQLPRETRTNFRALVKELKNRFRKVETAKTYQARFSNRDQKASESVEEYAAELKRLYDKAHGLRDRETRKEDLLRRFLDGLSNEQARFQVEYVKDPLDIDEAVYEVVNFMETRKRTNASEGDRKSRKQVRALKEVSSESEIDEDYDSKERAARTVGRPKGSGKDREPRPIGNNPEQSSGAKAVVAQPMAVTGLDDIKKTLGELVKSSADIQTRLGKLEKQSQVKGQNQGNQRKGPRPGGINSGTQRQRPNAPPNNAYSCFRCGQTDHFIRDCPYPVVMGQLQVAAQPMGFQGMAMPVARQPEASQATPRETGTAGSNNASQQSN